MSRTEDWPDLEAREEASAEQELMRKKKEKVFLADLEKTVEKSRTLLRSEGLAT